jgi:hypothetical protein
VEDWWQEHHPSSVRKKKPGRPALLSDPVVITLAIWKVAGCATGSARLF